MWKEWIDDKLVKNKKLSRNINKQKLDNSNTPSEYTKVNKFC